MTSPEEPPLRRDDLAGILAEAETPSAKFLVGVETEKFGVHSESLQSLGYGGDFSVCRVLESLREAHGWSPIRETPDGPVLGLRRGGASITLEPSAQVELSGEAWVDLHAIRRELSEHFREVGPISQELQIQWLSTGFHPIARLDELSWVPKQRYPIMRRFLPEQGSGGLDMMQRTCTTQANYDWSSEADGMRKLVVALKLAPLLHAWFANSPFKEGKPSGSLSERGHVWRHMDPKRSGLLFSLWETPEPRYEHYAEWALDAGMFLFKRDGVTFHNTGQSFRSFLEDGFEGHRPTRADWQAHLATLFPEVRLKNTLEVRSVDALPPALALASIAVWTGILYDETSLNDAHTFLSELSATEVETQRAALCARGLHASIEGKSGFWWAEELLRLAACGLERRARRDAEGRDESRFLEPAEAILESRRLPAEEALATALRTGSLVAATRVDIEAEALATYSGDPTHGVAVASSAIDG